MTTIRRPLPSEYRSVRALIETVATVRSNKVAVEFYLGHGWQIAREFAHEKYHHPMLELAKSLPGSPE